MEKTGSKLFFDRPAKPAQRAHLLAASYEKIGSCFESRAAHHLFFQYIFTPKSNAWAYSPAGKTGTNSALALLFELEFGVPLKATVSSEANLSDSALHLTMAAGVFRELLARHDIESLAGYLDKTVRIATIRNPTGRAWSSFRYLCKSNRLGSPQFVEERIRLTAATGFDWEEHPFTQDGFERFLDYVHLSVSGFAGRAPNSHWRPQWLDIRPDVYKPNVVGRLEEADKFERDLCEALGKRPKGASARLNVNDEMASLPEWIGRSEVRSRLISVYGKDYEAFGYEP
ncbi:sulfotransferase family 2 domain-containing protein [Tropicimonas sediminicola]|uniref:Sulfotransferase family protein n=1 Tax=Tropicimonas sediminicola TaxID=1031541 RepID=A0A239LVV5_9RHOB|nr:sulfotransferase family 2 domain-containing protein [Tropicimonas sediminicola]SNT34787.1 Sulfotransferase family protein [Tropicimonas sediminicola]